MMQLSRMKPGLKLHHNATQRDMYYLNQQDSRLFSMKMDSAAQVRYDAFARKYENNDRLMQSLFNDTAYINNKVDAGQLNYFLFKVASNIQNTEISNRLTLYDIFTDDEVYRKRMPGGISPSAAPPSTAACSPTPSATCCAA